MLKKIKYLGNTIPVHINSLFVLIPFIITGFALLAFLVAYHGSSVLSERFLFWGGVAVVLFAASSGIAITVVILNPIRKFINTVHRSPTFSKEMSDSESSVARRRDLSRFDFVFEEVANIISKVDARKRFPHIVGQSRSMRNVLSQVIKVGPTDTTVLILGESGVGKELIATSIHEESSRREKPFIKLNCVAIPTGLLESELFGHERGAFTGAAGRKIGKFEMANEGTLFLDEIGDMPLETQAKLLRVLQEREFERVGGNQTISVDVRFIAASNKNLQGMVEEGTFREDLFYRLNVFSIYMPPLRERLEDIPPLTRHILKMTPGEPELSPEAMRELMNHGWPGNVRELINILTRASVMAEDGQISTTGLAKNGRSLLKPTSGARDSKAEQAQAPLLNEDNLPAVQESFLDEDFKLDERLAALEQDIIIKALKKTGGVQSKAAELLGIKQRSLWHRVKKYDINVDDTKKHQKM